MELMNALQAFGATTDGRAPAADRSALRREAVETVLLLLGPFCPHITEELWSRLGHSRSLSEERWPEADRTALQRDEVTVVVQVDGRVRGRLTVEVGAPDERVTTLALADAKVRPWIEARQVARVVVIPGRLVNIVTGAN
jgi:leucyl-tRNA synthetase